MNFKTPKTKNKKPLSKKKAVQIFILQTPPFLRLRSGLAEGALNYSTSAASPTSAVLLLRPVRLVL